MVTVDSPLEALAFEYASFGIVAVVSNLWTWIAVVTAAVSFWGIRATTAGDSSPPVKLRHSSTVVEEIGAESERETAQIVDCEPPSTAEAVIPAEETVTATEKVFSRPLISNDRVTKGKLTVYYDGEEDLTVITDGPDAVTQGKLMVHNNGDGELTAGSEGELGEWWERWERVVRTKSGEDGWYRYIDLTVFNGNVVRLWDDNGVRYGGSFSVQRKVCCVW